MALPAESESYQFTRDFFTDRVPTIRRAMRHLARRPGIRRERDPDGYDRRFDHNVAAADGAGRVRKIVGCSQKVLRALELEHYDAMYVDGSHLASDVLEDAVLGFRLLKSGGVMILDDYAYDNPRRAGGNPGHRY